ncbi:MarR family transcriptional regulator [Clostridiaceae bacterium UIB06]|uniref:MarR family transcriptional regulator n=1 Tax=Clostridium thailandense TaxID=2794346 RepID=A0A949X633_9CLOT|nr:MarR family transcriptional regulator [Clostridium thailandense]MBV7276678.1 MarR family transcriptional regulator [Clostridium thailandense]MCH5137722.1 MarR family transcriptional regulator [Clostridiaceae bacterium UIB06]
MDHQALENIEIEMAVLQRFLASVSTYKKIGNLDRAAYLLLHTIIYEKNASVKAMADELHLDISTISRQVRGLEEKGYISRIADTSDRRAYFLEATELGQKEFNFYKQHALMRVSELLKNWSDEECKIFGLLLKKFNHSISDMLE